MVLAARARWRARVLPAAAGHSLYLERVVSITISIGAFSFNHAFIYVRPFAGYPTNLIPWPFCFLALAWRDSFTFVSNEKRNKVVSDAYYMHTQLSLMLFCLCVGCVSETLETFASGTSNTSSSTFSVGLALLPASFGLHMRAYACMSSWVPECACRDNKEIKNTTLRTFIQ